MKYKAFLFDEKDMEEQELIQIIDDLRNLPRETEWVEFKVSNYDPDKLGKSISSLANSACIHEKISAYLVYGIEDKDHDVVGTKKYLSSLKKGNEEITPWLVRMLSPKLDIRISDLKYKGKKISLTEIPAANNGPVKFQNLAYIRVGNSTKKLSDYPEFEKKIWARTSDSNFESEIALGSLEASDVTDLLDTQSYFDLINLKTPSTRKAIIERLMKEGFVKARNKKYQITNLGALLFAKDLDEFGDLARRAVRIIVYESKNKVKSVKDRTFELGYAAGFKKIIDYINDQIIIEEKTGEAFRETIKAFPEIAIRELVVNAIIHQDFREDTLGPRIEIFPDRIEITNSGRPLTEIQRFIDDNKSRNPKLANFMRKARICEERGSGIDKVIDAVEAYGLPPPDFQETNNNTRIILYSAIPLNKMSRKDKLRACYQHCCLKQVSNDYMTNKSLRYRFLITANNSATISRIINSCVEEGLIKPDDPDNKSRKHARYVPYWA